MTMRRTAAPPMRFAMSAPPYPPMMAPITITTNSGQYTIRAQMK